MRRALMAALVFVAATGMAGCGSHPRGRIHGVITYQGKPVTFGTVTFFGLDNMTYMADLNPDGTYSMAGVPQGTVRVCVQQPPPRPTPRPLSPGSRGPDPEEGKKAKLAAAPKPPAGDQGPRIPAKYADPKTSGLSLELTGPDQEWSVDLK